MSSLKNPLCRTLSAAALGLAFSIGSYAGEVTFGHISSVANPASADSAKQLRAGIQLAFDAANASGGVNGNTLKISLKDDALDAKKMVDLAGELVADPAVIGLIGFLNTVGSPRWRPLIFLTRTALHWWHRFKATRTSFKPPTSIRSGVRTAQKFRPSLKKRKPPTNKAWRL